MAAVVVGEMDMPNGSVRLPSERLSFPRSLWPSRVVHVYPLADPAEADAAAVAAAAEVCLEDGCLLRTLYGDILPVCGSSALGAQRGGRRKMAQKRGRETGGAHAAWLTYFGSEPGPLRCTACTG